MDVPCEIRLNRYRINSIDLPESVEARPGDIIILELFNEGSPLHLTISAPDGGRFTDFVHENVFLKEDAEVQVYLRNDIFPGTFTLQVITGYGANRSDLEVYVRDLPAPKEEEPVVVQPEPEAAPKLPVVSFAIVTAAALLFIVYVGTGLTVFEASAFLLLVAGVLAAWFLRP
ncbi:hypothetical protein E2N92_07990 [Methanofollis formosanus]|uniref:Uncharacterized protein n=1 Tax=Methanofollis formosanus TaxID=299308 RepID=A0A8G1A2V7_9EURY|nr:hypothetical protein [Methanofollis formosanus]QYZ79374.1 hypothetical protein E2N92_07990 [Methanofollis formosanus]